MILLGQPPPSGAPNSADVKASRAGRRLAPAKVLRLELAGADPGARVAGLEPLPGQVNYFIGNDPARWHPDIPTFAKVRCAEIYPGVTLIYYGSDQQLEYDFVVAPGADPDAIAFRVEGVDQLQIDARGDLCLRLGTDLIRHHKPLIYQMVDGARTEIEGGYRLKDERTAGFRLGRYDPSIPLVIDPVLSYSTYLGGNSGETIWDMAVDASGSAYVAGETMSALTNLVTPGALQTNFAGGTSVDGDAFVAKFNPTGSALVYLTYLGGKTDDSAQAIALDGQGNAYLTGFTDSTNFPTTPGAFQSQISGVPEVNFPIHPVDAFVAKLNPTGSTLIYSTYLGGSGADGGIGIAVDSLGNAYVVGRTESTNFPVRNALQTTNAGAADAFVTKLDASGSVLLYSTYLGGTNLDYGEGIAVDPLFNAYITGVTRSTNFPTANPFQPRLGSIGASDAFVAKLDPTGTNLLYSTYLGGGGDDFGYRIALDAACNAYVTGSTIPINFPTTPDGYNQGGVFKSLSAGASWAPSNRGLLHNVVRSLAIDPLTTSTLYAGTGYGVAKSIDAGATWSNSSAGLLFLDIRALAIDPSAPTTLYAGSFGGVLTSTNGAQTWFTNTTGLGFVTVNTLLLATSSTLYAGTPNGLFKTTNAAASWTPINAGLGNFHVHALAKDPTTAATLYAGTDLGVFKSTNSGASWNSSSTGLTNLIAVSLAIDPSAPATLYAGTADGVFKTLNGATNWSAAKAGLGSSNIIHALAVDPSASATLYAATSYGLFKSGDAGGSWAPINSGLTATNIGIVAIDPAVPATIYAGVLGTTSYGGADVFVTKLLPDGSAIGYSLFFGGNGKDEGWSIAVDSSGNAYVAGATTSTNFPVAQPPSARQGTNSGGSDAFIAQIDATGSALVYSFYLGGQANDFGYGIAVDTAGNAYVAGQTLSTNFPTRGPIQSAFAGGAGDSFILKVLTPPSLAVAIIGNTIVVSWPAPSPEFVLEMSATVGPTAIWTPVLAPPVVAGGRNTVTLPVSAAPQYFRLRGL